MESTEFKDYNIANISKDDIQSITELEQTISTKLNKDIVLIAYQSQEKPNKME